MLLSNVSLFPFQREAVDMAVARGNLLLAVVMGGGKTLISISAVEELEQFGKVKTGLVVVPSSLKYQWQREIMKFTGKRALVIDGPKPQRKRLYYLSPNFQYVVTNYESIINDWEDVKRLPLDYLIIDEATAIKSFRAKRSRALKALAKKVDHRFALTGQPIENRPEELFSIMEFVDPDVLGDFRSFESTFIVRNRWGKPVRYRNLPLLTERMKTAMYRKNRRDIADQMPKVIETVIPLEFSAKELFLYRHIAHDLLNTLVEARSMFGAGFDLFAHYGKRDSDDSAAMRMHGKIMSRLTALRMLCDGKFLLDNSAHHFMDETTTQGSEYAAELHAQGYLDSAYPYTKMQFVYEYVNDVLDSDPEVKVVIFSSFKDPLYYLSSMFGDCSVVYTGDLNAKQKDAVKQQFKTDPDKRVFLSSDAGGYGVDIPEANYLISLDLPWSTGKYEQREARIIRISSTWDHVNIISIVMKNSIEERMYNLLQEKKGVSGAFLDGDYDSTGGFKLSLETLVDFLSGGLHA